MDPRIAEMLGLSPEATVEEVLAAIGEMLAMVAEMAGEAGRPGTADAAAAAADATQEAAAAASDEQAAVDDAVASAVAATAIKAMAVEVTKLSARLDASEKREFMSRLMSTTTPGVRKWLMSQPVAVIRSYVESLPKDAPNVRQPKPADKGDSADLTPEDLQLCRITGTDPAIMRANRKAEIDRAKADGFTPPLRSKRMATGLGKVGG